MDFLRAYLNVTWIIWLNAAGIAECKLYSVWLPQTFLNSQAINKMCVQKYDNL